MGQMISISMSEGSADAYLAGPDDAPAAILFYMDAIGIRDDLTRMADRIAEWGYRVLLPDVFYRWAPYGPFDPHEIVRNPEALKPLLRLNRKLTNDLVKADAELFLNALVSKAPKAHRFGTVGYCLGGRCAFVTAAMAGDRVRLAASFHAGELAPDRDDGAQHLVGGIKSKFYAGIAEHDQYFDGPEEGRLAAALRGAGIDHTIEIYKGVHHGFAVYGTAAYDESASERHWRTLKALAAEHLAA